MEPQNTHDALCTERRDVLDTQNTKIVIKAKKAQLAGAPPAAAVDALHDPALLQLVLRHPADAVGGEVGVPGLDTAQAAQVLVALLLPLGDQGRVGDLLLDAVVVQLPGDRLPPVVQIEQVSGDG
jgi:hypothetical protein